MNGSSHKTANVQPVISKTTFPLRLNPGKKVTFRKKYFMNSGQPINSINYALIFKTRKALFEKKIK